jgi:hypothetical protein
MSSVGSFAVLLYLSIERDWTFTFAPLLLDAAADAATDATSSCCHFWYFWYCYSTASSYYWYCTASYYLLPLLVHHCSTIYASCGIVLPDPAKKGLPRCSTMCAICAALSSEPKVFLPRCSTICAICAALSSEPKVFSRLSPLTHTRTRTGHGFGGIRRDSERAVYRVLIP